MSSKMGRFLYLASNFIIGSFFLVLGGFSVILPWSSPLQDSLTNFILDNTLLFSLFGLGFALIGLSVIINAASNAKRRALYVRTGKKPISFDPALIQQYLDTYWKELFPHHQLSSDFVIKKKHLRIFVDLPIQSGKKDQQLLIKRIENDFADIFGNLLGYPHDVYLVATFKK